MIRDSRSRWMQAAIKLFGGAHPAHPSPPEPLSAADRGYPFALRDQLLSRAEGELFHVLDEALSDVAVICPKTRAADLLSVVDGARNLSEAVRIDRKTIDFLICDRRTFQPLAAVLVQRWLEQQQRYQARDRYLECSLVAAKLAVVHVRSNQIPTANRLRGKLMPLLANRRRSMQSVAARSSEKDR